jgi:hypothetical protein
MKNSFVNIVALLAICGTAWADTPLAEIQSKTNTIYSATINSQYGLSVMQDTLQALRDSVYMLRYPLYGANGLPALTGTKLLTAGGVSIGEGLIYMQNVTDSLRSELTSTTGLASFPTGVFHANGVSIAEALAWTQDSIRAIGAQLYDGTGEIDTTLENVRGAITTLQVDLDSLQLIGPQLSTTSEFTGTANADSFTCFTVSGEVWLTGLSFTTTAGAGATSELANFVLQQGAAGGVIVRVGEGKNLNNLAAGVCQWVNPATAVLSDSLAYVRNAASAANPIMEVIGWRMKLVTGSKIKLLMPGSSVATKARASMNWIPAARGSTVTAG